MREIKDESGQGADLFWREMDNRGVPGGYTQWDPHGWNDAVGNNATGAVFARRIANAGDSSVLLTDHITGTYSGRGTHGWVPDQPGKLLIWIVIRSGCAFEDDNDCCALVVYDAASQDYTVRQHDVYGPKCGIMCPATPSTGYGTKGFATMAAQALEFVALWRKTTLIARDMSSGYSWFGEWSNSEQVCSGSK